MNANNEVYTLRTFEGPARVTTSTSTGTVAGLMAAHLRAKYPPPAVIRGEYTSDGSRWAGGLGRVVAVYESRTEGWRRF